MNSCVYGSVYHSLLYAPCSMITRKVSPALAAGCTVQQTPPPPPPSQCSFTSTRTAIGHPELKEPCHGRFEVKLPVLIPKNITGYLSMQKCCLLCIVDSRDWTRQSYHASVLFISVICASLKAISCMPQVCAHTLLLVHR